MVIKGIKILLTTSLAIFTITAGIILLYNNATAQPPPQIRPPFFNDEEMLKRFDTDNDGKLNSEELKKMHEEMLKNAPPFLRQQSSNEEDTLKRFDTDGDGKLSSEELKKMQEDIFNNIPSMPGFMDGRPGGPGFGPPGFNQEDLVKKFDSDGDGKLNNNERKTAREYIKSQSSGRPNQNRQKKDVSQDKTIVEIEKTFSYDTKADLYDEKVLRTLYLQFPNEDWFDELADFYRTGVEVPADLTVDGIKYPSVGIRFRGNTSYMMTGEKKSLNISIDYGDDNQRLYGYKTLNLLNCNTDPSLMREVLYTKICRNYMPAPKANFVKLVINGENFGIYANVQQFNKDFLKDWFGTKDGVRWKVPVNFSGTGGLVWNGSDPANYKNFYELKTKDAPNAWTDLVKLCDTLNNTPTDKLESALDPIFNIDRALWFIALDNVFMDSDGYISRGSDYELYEDPQGRFHTITYDNNETFTYEGPGPGGPDREDSDQTQKPIINEKNKMRPVINRLLSIPHLHARYMAHVRTIANEWLDWQKLEPIIKGYQTLIDAEVKADDKLQYSYEAFANSPTQDSSGEEGFGLPGGGPPPGGFGSPPDDFGSDPNNFGFPPDNFGTPPDDFGPGGGGPGGGGPGPQSTPSFKNFIEERREFLLKHPDIDKPVPVIESVSTAAAGKESTKSASPLATESVNVKVKVGGDVKIDSVILYYAKGAEMPFESVIMFDDGAHSDGSSGDHVYGGEILPCPAGTIVHYYVEARSIASLGTTTFAPAETELSAFTYKVQLTITRERKNEQ